ncbi:hypothetical protein METBIDRAFT_41305 [Metschnikowia bicuspidata var. bicuspidata NRRL YB-4993]|uniref:Uncharacterized protein n=1 Tax=Metschnikowia bicuspidata var. bicuspidata NRRL YB-4993 TaxID=869754 RepID=A0A1A0HCL5_9ASCO|nr:hypothetical protein METBIDRAFT_41305 [Metschnikowia bicuspidata var. bicuspidata NRRL YB-4993]OBA21632.1 hypothetical protein METBIDRAFT_41305 [Metschnikowia bicuspidata var. bicuspidata NRRL YB-4993]
MLKHSPCGRGRQAASPMQARQLTLSPGAAGALRGYGTIVNIFAGVYFGGLVACASSLYFLYKDADSRQEIPFLLSLEDQILTVKAIGKDDVLKSPRHAVKHYRRLLLNMAKAETPGLQFDETLPDGTINYAVPLLPADVLVQPKHAELSNFYIDMVLRYSKALLAKNQPDTSVAILKAVIDNDDIFYRIGDAERMGQCCRVLSAVCPSAEDKVAYLQRSIHMLQQRFGSILLDLQYLLQDRTTISNELVLSLNALAFAYALQAQAAPRRQRPVFLTRSLNIYLANLKAVSAVREKLARGEITQAAVPLFDCQPANVEATEAEIKAHVAEILWAKGYQKQAVAWAEELVQATFYDKGNNARVSKVVSDTLDDLIVMYGKLKNPAAQERCRQAKSEVAVLEYDENSWYTSVIQKFTKVIYYKGPLGIIEKGLKERFGPEQPLPELEEFEEEDQE